MTEEQSSPQDFYRWAKEAGNKLRAYILSYASGATAVFFLALTGKAPVLQPGEADGLEGERRLPQPAAAADL
ncbi:MAG TPA: hypothetical protein VFZ54_17630, partial [Burkholderiales bacterium]